MLGKKQLIAALGGAIALGTTILPFAVAQTTPLPHFNYIYVFGDSLSDTGNLFNFTASSNPQSPPNFEGRFSNGSVWVEYLADDLNLQLAPFTQVRSNPSLMTNSINFAIGGATAGTGNNDVSVAGGLQQQVDAFTGLLTNTNQTADANALYIIWAGGNDYLFNGVTNPDEPVESISAAIASLANVGARNILVVNLPDLGKTPFGLQLGGERANTLNELSTAHNLALATTLDELRQSLPNVNLISVDVDTLFDQVRANPEAFGFSNVTEGCLAVSCSNPDTFLFWDSIHPTSAAHQLVGELALTALAPTSKSPLASVPPSPPTWSLLVLGVLALGVVLKGRELLQQDSSDRSSHKTGK